MVYTEKTMKQNCTIPALHQLTLTLRNKNTRTAGIKFNIKLLQPRKPAQSANKKGSLVQRELSR